MADLKVDLGNFLVEVSQLAGESSARLLSGCLYGICTIRKGPFRTTRIHISSSPQGLM
jgi:hypothetical protein